MEQKGVVSMPRRGSFEDLTWEDLQDWAGSRVVPRGKSYLRRVRDLRTTPAGKLLAWVQGGDRYATLVGLDKSGEPDSVCTCPYGTACKHAVATVLSYLNAVDVGDSVPVADEDDERLELLALEAADDDADWTPPVASSAGRRGSSESPEKTIDAYLESLSEAALRTFARELAADFAEVRQRILDRAELQTGDIAKLVKSTRRAIEAAASEPGWTAHWSGESSIPDYSRVKERLESLLVAGHPDQVVELGETLLDLGIRQINMSHDEGETGMEIAGCMAIVFRALKASTKTAAERLMWEIDVRLKDDYGILDSNEIAAALDFCSPADWSLVADELMTRMESVHVAGKGDGESHRSYHRQAIMRWLLGALESAGRKDEIAPILTREAELTNCYVELVDHLLSRRRGKDAEEWARKGFERTLESLPGIAWALEDRLREMATRRKNRPLVAAYRALEFFDRPDEQRYEAIRKAAEPLGHWETIRPLLLEWLETGKRPDESSAWPLPRTGLESATAREDHHRFPDTDTLIAIAIKEKRNDDALRWHHQSNQWGGCGFGHQGDAVAEAVSGTNPDEALTIWKAAAISHIRATKPSAYEVAGGYLRKMRAVYKHTDRLSEWDTLLRELRTEHARKRRFMDVLNRLEGKKSPILKQRNSKP